MILLLLLAC